MWEDIRPYARLMHLAFALLLALVGYCLMWYTLQGWEMKQRWRFAISCSFAAVYALVSHCILDWVVGVP